jgi:transposase
MDQPLCPGCSHRDREIDEPKKRIADLEKHLQDKERAGKRQAAPFSKGEPAPTPKKPGRKAGPNHGPHGHRPPPPETITQTLEAPLPEACPHCGGVLAEDADVDEQFQTDLPTQPIGRKFRIHKGCCTQCGRRLRSHHPLQTSDATGAAQSQIGPNAQAALVYLNKHSGMSYGKIADLFQQANGMDLQASTATRIVLWAAEQMQPTYAEIQESLQDSASIVVGGCHNQVGRLHRGP